MQVSAFTLAQRFVGLKEAPGPVSNPQVLAMLRLDDASIADDSTAWCSALVNFIAWLLRLPRSKSLAARSWLGVGTPIELRDAQPANDVVILNRGGSPDASQPGPGHVGFFAGLEYDAQDNPRFVLLLAGNQADQVSVLAFPVDRVLGVRRLA